MKAWKSMHFSAFKSTRIENLRNCTRRELEQQSIQAWKMQQQKKQLQIFKVHQPD